MKMSETGFTPGPWEALNRPRGVGITGAAAADFVIPSSLTQAEREAVEDYAIARCFTSLHGFDPIAERQANANLIAAAPCLYAALKGLLSARGELDRLEAEDAAQDALAKARGETPSTQPEQPQ